MEKTSAEQRHHELEQSMKKVLSDDASVQSTTNSNIDNNTQEVVGTMISGDQELPIIATRAGYLLG